MEIVNKLENGIKGGECIPMNFNNGGFIFEYNPELESLVSPETKAAVDEALAGFKASSDGLANWADVDYSTL